MHDLLIGLYEPRGIQADNMKRTRYQIGTPPKAGVYRRHLPPTQHTVGKLSMQKIERKHLTLRTRLKRLARKTLCFSHPFLMHDLLIGLYMNRVEFGCAV